MTSKARRGTSCIQLPKSQLKDKMKQEEKLLWLEIAHRNLWIYTVFRMIGVIK